jgi:flagellar FliJ protein
MKRLFPLAGLLRLRHLQQDQASVELAAANSTLRSHEQRHLHARGALSGLDLTPTNLAALHAVAAARASSRSMLSDLDTLGRSHRSAVDAAQVVFDVARADSVRLEKLEARHAEALVAEDLHAEQTVLDEIASTRWHRGQGGEPT